MDKEIKVAVIDSGYHPSNIYSDIRINRERKIVLEGESICKSSIAISTHMHGTYVLNTIQKYSKTRKVLYDIYNIFDEQGKASSKALICALEEIVEYPVDIIVISLTCSANHKKKLVEVINILKNKNIYILAAANNKLGNNYPACLSEVFGVKGKALFRNNIIYYKPNVEFQLCLNNQPEFIYFGKEENPVLFAGNSKSTAVMCGILINLFDRYKEKRIDDYLKDYMKNISDIKYVKNTNIEVNYDFLKTKELMQDLNLEEYNDLAIMKRRIKWNKENISCFVDVMKKYKIYNDIYYLNYNQFKTLEDIISYILNRIKMLDV